VYHSLGVFDGGTGHSARFACCEQESLRYTIALINERLTQMAEDLLEVAAQEHERTGKKARHFGEDRYGAAS